MLVMCNGCGIARELSRDRGAKCKSCQQKSRRGANWTPEGYKQTCVDCGDIRLTKNDTKADRCKECSNAKNMYETSQKNRVEEYKTYTHVCSECGKIRQSPAKKRKTTLCGDCSRKSTGKSNRGKDKMRYFRICPTCPEDSNTSQVTAKINSGMKQCKKCLNKDKREATIANPKKYSSKHKKYTKVGTDGAKRNKVTVKFQVVDLETMEAPVRAYAKKETSMSTPEQEQVMIDKFYKTCEPTIIHDKYKFGTCIDGQTNLKMYGSSAL